MKTIITVTFLFFSFLGFSQTTREEVVERNVNGFKKVVNTYSGTGNSEKLIKKTTYEDGNYLFTNTCCNNQISGMSLKPIKIRYYGSYKEEITYITNMDNKSAGEKRVCLSYGGIKEETFDGSGNLIKTWKITEEPTMLKTYQGVHYGNRVYTLIP
jgi:hypothetical protein